MLRGVTNFQNGASKASNSFINVGWQCMACTMQHGMQHHWLIQHGMACMRAWHAAWSMACTVWDILFPMRKKTIYQQVLKLGANEASAQGLQNTL